MGDTFFAGSLMPARSHTTAAAFPFSLGVHAAVVGGLLALPLLGGAPPPVVTARAPALPTPTIALPTVRLERPPVAPRNSVRRAGPRAPERPVMDAPAVTPVPLAQDLPALTELAEDTSACVGCALSTSGGPSGSGEAEAADGPGTGTATGTGSGEPFRIGGHLSAPAKIRHVDPAYPELAKRAGVQGKVEVECLIDADGRVTRARVVRGPALLDAAAVAAVEQWRYRPTLLNGVAVPVLMTVTVYFHLR
jgi:periplasmic protein TonB